MSQSARQGMAHCQGSANVGGKEGDQWFWVPAGWHMLWGDISLQWRKCLLCLNNPPVSRFTHSLLTTTHTAGHQGTMVMKSLTVYRPVGKSHGNPKIKQKSVVRKSSGPQTALIIVTNKMKQLAANV